MKKAKVVGRYHEGDYIRYSTSTKKHFVRDIVIGITDTTITFLHDTVAYHQIKLIEHLPRGLTIEKFGKDCIAAGTLLFIGDLINVTIVQDESYEADRGVVIASLTQIGVGIIFRLIGHPYLKIRRSNRLVIVGADSPLYRKPPARTF